VSRRAATSNPRLLAAREKALEMVADAVSRAVDHYRKTAPKYIYRGRACGAGYRSLATMLGRNVNRTMFDIMAEKDTTVTTLADIAEATGCELEIRMVPKAGRQPEAPADESPRAA
jgi:hypothetical protein